MQIAFTMAPGKGDTDLLLHDIARDFITRGHRVCGTAQINTECEPGGPCDMDVIVLPNGPVLRISQSLGADSKGCRLDPSALENAVGQAATELTAGADLVIINKFGKHEAEGRGFRPVIAEAILNDVPVLVGLNALNEVAFREFVGPEAVRLDPNKAAIDAWITDAIHGAHNAA